MTTGRPRLLVADDDDELLEMMVISLEQRGFQVVSASSGAELIQHLADHEVFDLIITDVSMPWMTGLQAAHAVRNAGLNVPVIVITALKGGGIDYEVRELGRRTTLLRKPFEISDLHNAVDSMLDLTEAQGAQ